MKKFLSFTVFALLVVSVTFTLSACGDDDDDDDDDYDEVFAMVLKSTNVAPDAREHVDLGLPSHTLWATMNVGANIPEEVGTLFRWGETQPPENGGYVYNYKWEDDNGRLLKYCTDADLGVRDNKKYLEPEDDAAFVNWGKNWRMPTPAQIKELFENCTWTPVRYENVGDFTYVGGYEVKSKINGKSIYIPTNNVKDDVFPIKQTRSSEYWSNRIYTDNPHSAYVLMPLDMTAPDYRSRFMFREVWEYCQGRDAAFAVRPVRS